MKRARRFLMTFLGLFLVFCAGMLWSRSRVAQADDEAKATPEAQAVPFAWDRQLAIYYPAQKKVYVYTALGGSCVFAYTLGAPGGHITRENCR